MAAQNIDTSGYVDLTLKSDKVDSHLCTVSGMGRPAVPKDVVDRVVAMRSADMTVQEVADEVGLSRASIFNIWRREGVYDHNVRMPNGFRKCTECGAVVPSDDPDLAKFTRKSACSETCLRAKHRRHNRSTKFGVTDDEFQKMVKRRHGRCDICHEVPAETLAIDHDHVTGQIRGLLCRRCNCGIGMLHGDDVARFKELVASAITYLTGGE